MKMTVTITIFIARIRLTLHQVILNWLTENVLHLGTFRSDGKTGCDSGDCPSSVNGGSAKSSEGISPVQLSKFCHECGTKYPVEWAKFCCECGIRRMVV